MTPRTLTSPPPLTANTLTAVDLTAVFGDGEEGVRTWAGDYFAFVLAHVATGAGGLPVTLDPAAGLLRKLAEEFAESARERIEVRGIWFRPHPSRLEVAVLIPEGELERELEVRTLFNALTREHGVVGIAELSVYFENEPQPEDAFQGEPL